MDDLLNLKGSKQRVIVVAIDFKREKRIWQPQEILEEMKALVEACECEVVGEFICKVDKPSSNNLIGKGKAEEIKFLCDSTDGVDIIIFSEDIKGSQQRNLEEFIGKSVIDRTRLILDIFARRATTREGKTQVELAQLQYLMPRLVGHGVEMSRLGGGIGTLGPGETKLEIDRRRISQRIDKLKRELKELVANRSITRIRRKDNKVPLIALVGYTNAGKSTLMNRLTGAGQSTQDGLFTTLASVSRQWLLPNNQKTILSDTIGFMHDLPHHLIESFKATLEEVQQADLLLHMVDLSNPNFKHMYEAVIEVLVQLNANDKSTIVVFNKIDQLPERFNLKDLGTSFEKAIMISAKTGENVDSLINMVSQILAKTRIEVSALIPLNRADLIGWLHENSDVITKEYREDGCHVVCRIPEPKIGHVKEYIIDNPLLDKDLESY
ncbi:MAG: GTPase HflX [Candidatus Omnitrophica bacterium]|nr:GTPase HflX [Candidatus Omnitrophota bacterium]